MFKIDLEQAEEPEIKLPTSTGSLKKQQFQTNIYFCSIDYAKTFDCVDCNKLWKIFQLIGILDHLTCLLSNLYAGQEATVRTRHGTRDCFQIRKGACQGFQIRKGACQGCILSPCLFSLCADYITWNVGLDETQSGVKISGRSINNLRYADDNTLWQKAKNN